MHMHPYTTDSLNTQAHSAIPSATLPDGWQIPPGMAIRVTAALTLTHLHHLHPLDHPHSLFACRHTQGSV